MESNHLWTIDPGATDHVTKIEKSLWSFSEFHLEENRFMWPIISKWKSKGLEHAS